MLNINLFINLESENINKYKIKSQHWPTELCSFGNSANILHHNQICYTILDTDIDIARIYSTLLHFVLIKLTRPMQYAKLYHCTQNYIFVLGLIWKIIIWKLAGQFFC